MRQNWRLVVQKLIVITPENAVMRGIVSGLVFAAAWLVVQHVFLGQ